MKTAVIAVTPSASPLAQRIARDLPDCTPLIELEKGWLKKNTERLFREYEGLIFLMATGIVVRMIAPYVESKYRDPAVVVVDDAARYAISLLSGHEGGANALALRVGTILNACPVVTTASDTNRKIIAGVGCRRGTTAGEIDRAVTEALTRKGLTWDQVRLGASVDLKQDEQGLLECFYNRGLGVRFFSVTRINQFDGPYETSETAKKNIGARAVAEPCALLGGRNTRLISPKTVTGPVTVALAEEDSL